MKSPHAFALARHVARAALFGSVLAACGSSGPSGTPGTAGSSTGSAGSGGAGASGSAGVTGTAGVSGSAGVTGSAGASSSAGASGTAGTTSGSAGAGGAQSNPDGGTAPDGNAGDFPTGTCGAGSIFCDDFEEYNLPGAKVDPTGFVGNNLQDFIAVGSTAPTWLGYHFHGPPYIADANVFGGKQVYQLDHETGHAEATDIIKEAPDGVDLWPAAHYGRVMINLKSLPVTGSVGIMTESGLLPGSTTNTAQYTLGATDGKLSFSYMQRKRPFKNDVSTPLMRIGGNWENAAEAPTTYCTFTATTATIAANKWVCVEWMVDRTNPELHVWLDGAAQADLDVSGGGGTCSAGTAPTWTGPAHFTELDLGWEINGNDTGGTPVQFDMFAIGTQKLGCPAM